MSWKPLVVAALAATIVPSVARADDCARKVGELMPPIRATDTGGKSITIQPTSGWIFVTVGAKWCEPCAKELPAWDKIAPNHPKVQWYAVDIDEKIDDGKAFHDKLGIKNMNRTYTRESSIGNLGAVMPSSYVVDSKGVIRYERCGFEKGDVDGEVKAMTDALAKLGL
jgi:thiol-disulfide isomerase/thioredoxin